MRAIQSISALILVGLLLPGGCRKEDPLLFYKIENRHEKDRQLDTLPVILRGNDPRPNVDPPANTREWYRLAKVHDLKAKGKTIDDAIKAYGEKYIVRLTRGRNNPRMYYRLSGAYNKGIFGVVDLDKKLRINRVTTDPEF